MDSECDHKVGNKVTLSNNIVWINVMSLPDDDNMIFY